MSKGVNSDETKCKTFEIKHFQSYLNKQMFKTCQNIVIFLTLNLLDLPESLTALTSLNTDSKCLKLETLSWLKVLLTFNSIYNIWKVKTKKNKKCSTTRIVV